MHMLVLPGRARPRAAVAAEGPGPKLMARRQHLSPAIRPVDPAEVNDSGAQRTMSIRIAGELVEMARAETRDECMQIVREEC